MGDNAEALNTADDLECPTTLAPAMRFRFVRALETQTFEVFGSDISRHVFARETRRIEVLERSIIVPAGFDQILEILIDKPVGADQFGDLLRGAAARDELVDRGHIDTIDIREAHRRCCGSEIYLSRSCFARDIDDLRGCRTTNDRVVDEQHILPAKLQIDGVQLAAYRFFPQLLPRHDERAADVAVLDE